MEWTAHYSNEIPKNWETRDYLEYAQECLAYYQVIPLAIIWRLGQ